MLKKLTSFSWSYLILCLNFFVILRKIGIILIKNKFNPKKPAWLILAKKKRATKIVDIERGLILWKRYLKTDISEWDKLVYEILGFMHANISCTLKILNLKFLCGNFSRRTKAFFLKFWVACSIIENTIFLNSLIIVWHLYQFPSNFAKN